MADKKKQAPKKKGLSDYIIYLVIAVVLTVVCMWAGYVVDETASRKSINIEKAMSKYSEYLNVSSFFSAAQRAISDDSSYSKKFAMVGAMGGLLIFAVCASKTQKRYHRKGVEHGSAAWGTDAEKKLIQDTQDFYNNAIISADVLLVIDRKKRDENALSKEQGNKKAIDPSVQKEKHKEKIEKKLKAAISKYENSPTGN